MNGMTIVLVIPFIVSFLSSRFCLLYMPNFHCVHVFVVIHRFFKNRQLLCGKSEFDIYEAKKCFPDSEKAWVLKRKDAKIQFFNFFASIHRPSLNQGSFFSLRKFQIRIPRMFLGLFLEKLSKIFSRGDPPPLPIV